ncbi:MAG: NAD(P)/FAD-dependent oxidoreductase [Myxococcota bacterium]
MNNELPRVVIVGAGFGGLKTARVLGSSGFDVTVVDRRNHHVFQPLLYQVATAGLAVTDIATPVRDAIGDAPNTRVLLAEVTDVDTDAKEVHLKDAEALPYDYLVVAAGAKTNFHGVEAAQTHGLGLKTLEDARVIRQRVLACLELAEHEPDARARAALTTFVVVGAGPTGVELAGALRELARSSSVGRRQRVQADDVRVILAERGDRVLPQFSEELSATAKTQLEELGVEVRTHAALDVTGPRTVLLDGEVIEVGALAWAAGVKAVPLAAKLGETTRDGRVIVTSDCSLPDAPTVFAIGDIAAFTPKGEERPLPGLAPVAIQQGEFVANRIRDLEAGRPATRFTYVDRGTMATIGRSRAVVQRGRFELGGRVAWMAWLGVHLASLIGFRNRVAVFLSWAWSYFTYRRGHRLLLPPAPQLRRATAESNARVPALVPDRDAA